MNTITVNELKNELDNNEDIQLVDVREDWECEICKIGGISIPLSVLPSQVDKIDREKPVVVYCHSGMRSANAIQFLEHTYHLDNLYNLSGGISEWIRVIDPSLQDY